MSDWLVVLLSSGGMIVVLETIKEIIMWNKNRKAQKEDKGGEMIDKSIKKLNDSLNRGLVSFNDRIDKIDYRIDRIDKKQDIQSEALMTLMGLQIDDWSTKYLIRGCITPLELVTLEGLYASYSRCGGDGARTAKVNRCRNLPLVEGSEDD